MFYLNGRIREERQRKKSCILWLTLQIATMAKGGQPGARRFFQVSQLGIGALGLQPLLLSQPSLRSWESEAARAQTNSYVMSLFAETGLAYLTMRWTV